MEEAFIYDSVRSPRGKGKSDGSLHELTSVYLSSEILKAIRDRNHLDTSILDDVKIITDWQRWYTIKSKNYVAVLYKDDITTYGYTF